MSIRVNVDSTLGGVKLILNGYKNLCIQYRRHGNTDFHKEAFESMKKTVKYELDDMLNRNLFVNSGHVKKTFNMDHFQPKASKNFKRRVLEDSFFNASKNLADDIKVNEEVTLKTENYELITDMNMLAHAYENKFNEELIKQIILEKNKRTNVFSAAFNKKPLLKRIKEHLDIAKENSHYVPKHLEAFFFIYLKFLNRQYQALHHPLLEFDYPKTNTNVIPYKLRKQSSRLMKTIPIQGNPLELHKLGILRLQHIIDRLQHGPSVRFSSFQSPIKNIHYCIPATDKNKPDDKIFTIYYERMRYQSHLWEANYRSTLFASLPEIRNAFLPEIGEKVPKDIDYKHLFFDGEFDSTKNENLEIYNDIKKHQFDERAKFGGFLSPKELTLLYIDAFERDHQNLLKLKAKYDKLDLDRVDPYVKKKELLCQLVQNDLISDMNTYSSIGFVLYRFMKHVKFLHIKYYHDQIK